MKENFFSKNKLLLCLILILVGSFIYLLKSEGFIPAISLLISLVIVIRVTKGIWYPKGYYKYSIRRYSIAAFVTLGIFLISNNLFGEVITRLVLDFAYNYFPMLKEYEFIEKSISLVIIGVIVSFLGIMGINFFIRDKAEMNSYKSTSFSSFIDDNDFKNGLNNLIFNIKREHKIIDNQVGWSWIEYIPIEGTLKTNNKQSRVDLSKFLKNEGVNNTIILLGEPGSGKTILLRKLSIGLLNQIYKTEKIPIYINLKEWEFNGFDLEKDSLDSSLDSFIFNNLKDRYGQGKISFISEYFYKLIGRGHLFFILDSFDEIPYLVKTNYDRNVIDKVSECISKYICRNETNKSILASRFYNKPVLSYFIGLVSIRILPVKEIALKKALETQIGLSEKDIIELFRRDAFIGSFINNPFHFKLLKRYVKDNLKIDFPDNLYDIYDYFISISLKENEAELDLEEIHHLGGEIAEQIFLNSEKGFRVRNELLEKHIGNEKFQILKKCLIDARLAVAGGGDFSFSHRRIHDYFLIQSITNNGDFNIPFNDIATFGKWRDTLVLFCLKSKSENVNEIIKYCLKEINENVNKKYSNTYHRFYHCLIFLAEIYNCNNINTNLSIGKETFNALLEKAENGDLLDKKIVIESSTLMSEEQITQTLVIGLEERNHFLSKLSIYASRRIKNPNKYLKGLIENYIESLNYFSFIRKYEELKFSFSFSDGFKPIISYLKKKYIDSILFGVAQIVLILLNPILMVLPLVFYYVTIIKEGPRKKIGQMTLLRLIFLELLSQ